MERDDGGVGETVPGENVIVVRRMAKGSLQTRIKGQLNSLTLKLP